MEILAKLQETLQNPLMRKEMCSHMQDLLHEFNIAKEEKGVERPLLQDSRFTHIRARRKEKMKGYPWCMVHWMTSNKT